MHVPVPYEKLSSILFSEDRFILRILVRSMSYVTLFLEIAQSM